jgi:predicted DNA-binding transcriptional regulator YafY
MDRAQETRRTARLLNMIHLIANAPRQWTRKRLAGQYEVSERQITKDLEILKHGLCFEIEHAREGYYFARVPRLPTAAFSFEEALALLLATRAGGALAGVDGEALAAAVGRLESLFPRDLRPVLRAAEPDADDPTGRAARLAVLERAVAGRTQVRIEYAATSRDGAISERTVDPFAVVSYGKSWHVVGHCHLRHAVRIFKVDRIRQLRPLDTRFPPPADFDLDRYLGESWGRMPGVAGPVEEVALRFFPPAATFVAEEQWHRTQRVELQPDGTILFRVAVTVTPEFRHWVYRYGRQVEVLAPEGLREWVAAEARAVAARYP